MILNYFYPDETEDAFHFVCCNDLKYIFPGSHFESECITAEQAEDYYELCEKEFSKSKL